jgi:hypothetical protein
MDIDWDCAFVKKMIKLIPLVLATLGSDVRFRFEVKKVRSSLHVHATDDGLEVVVSYSSGLDDANSKTVSHHSCAYMYYLHY